MTSQDFLNFKVDENKSLQRLVSFQDQVLELAVKVVIDPTYGWITATTILYGCRPEEIFSLIPNANGTGSVLNIKNTYQYNLRRKVLAIPKDFVEKLNICDQVSKPISTITLNEFNKQEVKVIMDNWSNWFKRINNELTLNDFRDLWAYRSIKEGISSKNLASYMGVTHVEFLKRYRTLLN